MPVAKSVSEDEKKSNDRLMKQIPKIPKSVVTNNVSTDSTCSSDSWSNSWAKNVVPRRTVRRNGSKSVKIVPDGTVGVTLSPKASSRCDWITPNSGM